MAPLVASQPGPGKLATFWSKLSRKNDNNPPVSIIDACALEQLADEPLKLTLKVKEEDVASPLTLTLTGAASQRVDAPPTTIASPIKSTEPVAVTSPKEAGKLAGLFSRLRKKPSSAAPGNITVTVEDILLLFKVNPNSAEHPLHIQMVPAQENIEDAMQRFEQQLLLEADVDEGITKLHGIEEILKANPSTGALKPTTDQATVADPAQNTSSSVETKLPKKLAMFYEKITNWVPPGFREEEVQHASSAGHTDMGVHPSDGAVAVKVTQGSSKSAQTKKDSGNAPGIFPKLMHKIRGNKGQVDVAQQLVVVMAVDESNVDAPVRLHITAKAANDDGSGAAVVKGAASDSAVAPASVTSPTTASAHETRLLHQIASKFEAAMQRMRKGGTHTEQTDLVRVILTVTEGPEAVDRPIRLDILGLSSFQDQPPAPRSASPVASGVANDKGQKASKLGGFWSKMVPKKQAIEASQLIRVQLLVDESNQDAPVCLNIAPAKAAAAAAAAPAAAPVPAPELVKCLLDGSAKPSKISLMWAKIRNKKSSAGPAETVCAAIVVDESASDKPIRLLLTIKPDTAGKQPSAKLK